MYTAPDPNTPDTTSSVDAPSVNTVYGSFFQTGFNTKLFTATTATPIVFGGQFAAINFNPSAGQAGCAFPAGTTPITSSARPFADVIPQQDGSCAVQRAWSSDPGHQYQAGVTTTVPLYSFQAVFTATLAIMAPGPVTFATSADDTYQLAIGPNKDNPAQQPSSVAATPTVPITAPTVGPFTGYPVMDAAYPDARGYTLQTTVTVNFPAAGVYPIEVDYAECCGDGARLAMSARAGAGAGGSGPTTVLLGDQNLVPNDCPCDATQLNRGDPINTRTGNAWTSGTDLSVPAPGPALVWSRTYSSQEGGDGSAGLGYGWQDGYATRLITGGVTTVVSPEGNRLRFIDEGNGQFRPFPGVYDTLVRAGNVYTDTRQSQDAVTFDAATGRATTITDPQGRQLLLQYNGQGQLARITDASNAGRYLTLSYNGATIAGVSDAAGRGVGYAYDGSGNLTGVTDVMGHTTTYAYATPANHLLTGVANALGQAVEQTSYDTSVSPPRVSGQTLQDGTTLALSYAAGSTTVTTTGPDGTQDTEQILYDPQRNVMTGVVRDGVTTQQEAVDANFGPTASADANGNTTTTIFNRAGLPLSVTDPLSGTTSVGYDARENPITVTDQLGRQSLSVYDANNNLVRQTSGITTGSPGLTTAYTYTVSNGQSLLTAQQAPDGVVTHDTYNAAGQLTAQIAGYGASGALETDYGYDAAGRAVTTTVGAGTALQRVDVTRYNADDSVAATIADNTGAGTFDPAQPDRNVTRSYGYDPLGRQVAVTDTLGHVTATHYNAAGQADWTARNLAPAQLDSQGQPVYQAFSPAQPDQNVATLYGYDALGRQTLVTQTGILTGTFDAATRQFGLVTTRTTRTEYDALSRPVTTTLNYQPGQPVNTLPDVNVQSLRQYDAQGNVIGQRDALGRWTVTAYDALNRPVTTTVNDVTGNPLAGGVDTDLVRVTRYNGDGTTAQTIDNDVTGQFSAAAPITDRVTGYGYDPLGRLVTTTVNLDTNPADAGRPDVNRVSVTAYNGLGQVAGRRDALGRWTATGYDALGRVSATIQNCTDGGGSPVNPGTGACAAFNAGSPDRNVPSGTRYDALGRAFESVDALGHVTHSAYDGLGQTVAITGNYVAGGAATSDTNVGSATTYDALGRATGATDATGASTSNGYDALGDAITATDALSRTTRSGYDGAGAPRWSMTPDGRLTVYRVDGLGRTVATIQNYATGVVTAGTPADQDLTTATVYDLGGRQVRTIDAAGRATAYGYDLLDHQTYAQRNARASCTAGATDCNVLTTYAYDRAGHRISLTDPNGHTRGSTFDAADEQTAATDALGRATRRDYDLGGRVTARHDPRGPANDLAYSYDGLDRLTGTAAQNLPAPIRAQYDALGRRTGLSDGTGTTTFGYDAVGRTTAITAPGTGTVGYSYDAAGRRTGLRYPDGLALGYSYYGDGQLQGVTQGGSPLAGYSYDAAGRLRQVSRVNGTVTSYGYDGADRVLDQRTTAPGGQLSDFAAAVDRLGRRTVVTESVGLDPNTEDIAIDAGGGTALPFLRDTDYSGGAISSTLAAIAIDGVSRPAPQAVYQSERQGQSFQYVLPSLAPGAAYTARLHFAEIDGNAPGQRRFNVAINATQVLTGYDIAAAVGQDHAVVVEAPAVADSYGNVTIQYTGVGGAAATASGIELLPRAAVTTTASLAPRLGAVALVATRTLQIGGGTSRGGRDGSARASAAIGVVRPRAVTRSAAPAVRAGAARPATAPATAPLTAAATAGALADRLPLRFEANGGQSAARARYVARAGGYVLFLTANTAVLALSPALTPTAATPVGATTPVTRALVQLRFVGAAATPAIEARDPLSGTVTYLRGGGPAAGRAVAAYGQVVYHDLYPGIDLVYDGTGGALEYSFVVAPGADPRAIGLAFDGVRGRRQDAHGALVLGTARGDLVQRAPAAYQEVDGRRVPVAASYAPTGTVGATIALGRYDPTKPLVIDPVLSYGTYLGGTGMDRATGVATDARGAVYLTGLSASPDFPTQAALQAGYDGGYAGDAFVAKLSPDGSRLVYSTYLGGTGDDAGAGIAVDGAGDAYVVGNTASTDFPTKNALQASNGGGHDAFVAELNPSGSALLWGTYLGGNSDDWGNAIALDATGDPVVAGTTTSTDFPTKNALQSAPKNGRDAFVAKLAANGSALLWSTYDGGSGDDWGNAVALDPAGNVYVAGQTASVDFPITHAVQATYGGGYNGDAFVAELRADGGAIVYSTYLGGSGDDKALGLAVDPAGEALVTGNTTSTNFPTRNAYQPASGGGYNGDAFVAKVAAGGGALVYSTYLGGSGDDYGNAIATDASGVAYVAGATASPNFPVARAAQWTYNDVGPGCYSTPCGDAFAVALGADGRALRWGTYLGGSAADGATALATDCAGNVDLAGYTQSPDFPTAGPAVQGSFASTYGYDAFAARLGTTRAITYSYDGVDRLTDAGGCLAPTYHYAYDAAGNRTGETVDGAQAQRVAYDAANQVITATTPRGTATYGYDAAGNLLSDGTSSYSYDALDRLTALAGISATESYGYNGDGVLVTQTVNGVPTLYTQDLAAGQDQVLQTATGVGTPAVTDYLYGLDRLAALPSGGTARTWYGADLQGSVRYTTDDGANINSGTQVTYDPYGVPEGGVRPPSPFGYTGELQDAATSLQYLRARTYNPVAGQFLQRDPLEQQTGQAYLYASGDPVNNSDPSGQCTVGRVKLPGGGSYACTPQYITGYVRGTAGRPQVIHPLTGAQRTCIAQTIMRETGAAVADVGLQEAVGAGGVAEVGVAPGVAGGGGELGTGAGLGLGTLAAGTVIGVGVIGVGVITFVHLRAGDDLYAPETRPQCAYVPGQVGQTCVEPGTTTVPLPLPVPNNPPAPPTTALKDPDKPAYRHGNRNARNLTPSPKDIADDPPFGLSLSTTPGKGIEFPTGKTGLLGLGFIVVDKPSPRDPGHFLLSPGALFTAGGLTLQAWVASRDTTDNSNPKTWYPLTQRLAEAAVPPVLPK